MSNDSTKTPDVSDEMIRAMFPGLPTNLTAEQTAIVVSMLDALRGVALAAREYEREECAKVADDDAARAVAACIWGVTPTAIRIAAGIRARGSK